MDQRETTRRPGSAPLSLCANALPASFLPHSRCADVRVLLLLLPLLGKIHLGTGFVHPDTVLPVKRPTLVHLTMLGSILVFAVQAAHGVPGRLAMTDQQ